MGSLTNDASWLDRVRTEFDAVGLYLFGVADGQGYENILPGCQSVLVFANGGTKLWDSFASDLKHHPEHLQNEAHPFDAFVRRLVQTTDAHPEASRRWVMCASDELIQIDFRTLALQAGVGWQSRLGLVLNDEFGPWIGLRAACFTTEKYAPKGPRAELGPCKECAAPCASACPAQAIANVSPFVGQSGFKVDVCARWHGETTDCATTCHARMACPIGSNHQYSALQRTYHYNPPVGRALLAKELGIEDKKSGIAPDWKSWVKKT